MGGNKGAAVFSELELRNINMGLGDVSKESAEQFTHSKNREFAPAFDVNDDFDTLWLPEKSEKYCGGKRTRVARASNCAIEYVSNVAYIGSKNKRDRKLARDYISWFLLTRAEGETTKDKPDYKL